MSVRFNWFTVVQVFYFLSELLLSCSILKTHESWGLGNSSSKCQEGRFHSEISSLDREVAITSLCAYMTCVHGERFFPFLTRALILL